MKKYGYRIFINAIILVSAWTGLSIMDDMAGKEDSHRLSAFTEASKRAGQDMIKAQLTEAKAGFKRCTNEPFLTDHVLIVGSRLGVGEYATGVVYEVTFDQAIDKANPHHILAYCE